MRAQGGAVSYPLHTILHESTRWGCLLPIAHNIPVMTQDSRRWVQEMIRIKLSAPWYIWASVCPSQYSDPCDP
ncbi:hypothetical protein FKM82_025031 [Ascaphus truei]